MVQHQPVADIDAGMVDRGRTDLEQQHVAVLQRLVIAELVEVEAVEIVLDYTLAPVPPIGIARRQGQDEAALLPVPVAHQRVAVGDAVAERPLLVRRHGQHVAPEEEFRPVHGIEHDDAPRHVVLGSLRHVGLRRAVEPVRMGMHDGAQFARRPHFRHETGVDLERRRLFFGDVGAGHVAFAAVLAQHDAAHFFRSALARMIEDGVAHGVRDLEHRRHQRVLETAGKPENGSSPSAPKRALQPESLWLQTSRWAASVGASLAVNFAAPA